MAEFSEVIRQKKRMCSSVLCCNCDIYRLCGEDLSKCAQFINNNPKKAEEVIMSWAAEHQEPVYPTWRDLFERMGANIRCDGTVQFQLFAADKPIPADIARKLGIAPKEE